MGISPGSAMTHPPINTTICSPLDLAFFAESQSPVGFSSTPQFPLPWPVPVYGQLQMHALAQLQQPIPAQDASTYQPMPSDLLAIANYLYMYAPLLALEFAQAFALL